tara:strand:- start:2384 stop:3499 length:1116 start_codon:yes stop_codon:yes gene_type:complete
MGCKIERTLKYQVKQVICMDGFTRKSSLIEDDTTSPNSASKSKSKSLVEVLLGDSENFKVVAEKFNLDPDMSDKILVPLLSLLDKYGIGESLTASPHAESASQTFDIIRDVSPIVKGAAEYISGKRKQLEKDDIDFLNSIRQSQKVNDTSLFNGDEGEDDLFSIGESVNNNPVPPQAPIQPLQNFNAFQKNDWGNFWADATGANDADPTLENDLTRSMQKQQDDLNAWANEQNGGSMKREQSGAFISKQEGLGGEFNLGEGAFSDTFAGSNNTSFGLVDVTVLAKESGLSMAEIMDGDSQSKINGDKYEETNYEIDMSEFEEIGETVIDYSKFETPVDAENYNPLHIPGVEVPQFKVDLDEFKDYLPEMED